MVVSNHNIFQNANSKERDDLIKTSLKKRNTFTDEDKSMLDDAHRAPVEGNLITGDGWRLTPSDEGTRMLQRVWIQPWKTMEIEQVPVLTCMRHRHRHWHGAIYIPLYVRIQIRLCIYSVGIQY